ncbi:TetR/AcrR family transcriptional regulator [Staphylococcus taiwanensis]|nr:TetR/AcrR family transcriptional regulator [Staphylococcus taiwanensis]
MTYSRKTQLTQRLLKQALINLLKHKHFEEVTINEIAQEAYVTRSTFYRYYDDKYELLSDIEDEMLNFIKEQREFDLKSDENIEVFEIRSIVNLFEKLEPYSEVLKVLLTNAGIISFKMKIRNLISKRFEFLSHISYGSKLRRELGKEYLIAIIVNTFEYWAQNKDEIDVEEIGQFIIEIYQSGMIKALNLKSEDLRKLN